MSNLSKALHDTRPYWTRERPIISVEQYNRTRDLRAAPLYSDLHVLIAAATAPEPRPAPPASELASDSGER